METTPWRRWVPFVPGALCGLAVLGGLLCLDTPLTQVARYALHLLLGILLPGLLVHRSLRGRPTSLVADLALGAATGTALMLVGLGIFVSAGLPGLLWVWPALILAVHAVVPRLRRSWAFGGYEPEGRGGVWLLTASYAGYGLSLLGQHARDALPPAANDYYVDVYWHLANAAELTRRFPPEVPSVSGRTLRYHWFADADMAAAHLTTGTDLPTLVLRLWPLVMPAIVAGLLYALVRRLTGASWPAGLAVAMLLLPAMFMPWSWYTTVAPVSVMHGSPSTTYGAIAILLAAHVLVDIVRGERVGRGGWALLVLAALLAPGAKPSVTPLLLAGVGGALLVRLLAERSVRRLGPFAGALGVLGAAGVALAPLVAQAQAASGVKVLGILGHDSVWREYVPATDLPATGGPVIASLGAHGAALLAAGLVLGLLLQVAWIWLAVLLPVRPRSIDPALVFLLTAFAAAMVLTLVVDHAGRSQIYIERSGVPLAVVAAAWGVSAAWTAAEERAGRRRALLLAGGGAAAGLLAYGVAKLAGSGGRPPVEDFPWAIWKPQLVLLAVLILGVVAWRLLRHRLSGRGLGALVAAAATLAVFLPQGAWITADYGYRGATDPVPLPPTAVTRAETRAARWVRDHTPPDAVLVTGTHCRFQQPFEYCESRSWWVTALTERRAVVESWAYTEENFHQVGRYATGFPLFPFDDPDRLRLNDAAIAAPTPEVLRELKERYGATWIFADSRATRVSPRLRTLARLRFRAGTVRVFELR